MHFSCSAGVDSGSRLRVRGEGNSGRRGGESGDLYVFISIKDHGEMRREGTTIHSDVEISYVDAILGTQVQAYAWTDYYGVYHHYHGVTIRDHVIIYFASRVKSIVCHIDKCTQSSPIFSSRLK